MKILTILLLLISLKAFSQTPEHKLKQLNINLPEPGQSLGSYLDVVQTGKLLYLSGKGPLKSDGEYVTGKLGKELTVEQGYQAARITAINQIAVLKKFLGKLSKIRRIVKVNGYVNSESTFYDQPKVVNGYSDLMIAVFGEPGKHSRTAIGTNTLPFNMSLEVEMIVELQ